MSSSDRPAMSWRQRRRRRRPAAAAAGRPASPVSPPPSPVRPRARGGRQRVDGQPALGAPNDGRLLGGLMRFRQSRSAQKGEGPLPKQKTHKGAAKRFKLTATGKVKRHQSMHSHILTKKTTKRKRNLRKATL